MNERYPNATSAELERLSDRTCIICREDMVAFNDNQNGLNNNDNNDNDNNNNNNIDNNNNENNNIDNGNNQPANATGRTQSRNSGMGDTPKKLPCGHIFHFHCLRSWLE